MSDLPPLIDGLLYPSEDDRPFEPIDWPAGPASAQAAVARHLPGRCVQESLLSAFFDPLRDATDAHRFAALHRALAAGLTDPATFRVPTGGAEVDVYLIGRTPTGRWAGVRTVSVET